MFLKLKKTSRSALAELVIALAIIGILVAVAIPYFRTSHLESITDLEAVRRNFHDRNTSKNCAPLQP